MIATFVATVTSQIEGKDARMLEYLSAALPAMPQLLTVD